MKSIQYIVALAAVLCIALTSCSDYLEREPLSQGTEAIFFKTPEHFEQAANALYNLEGWKDYNGGNLFFRDGGTDISGVGSNNGGGSAPQSNWRWNRPYQYIRNCNILLEKAIEYQSNQSEIAPWVGTAYFFRAWQHFYLLQTFGGVPIADHTLDVNDPVVYGERNSRYEVMNLIINDLRAAIPMLPEERTLAEVDKGKVTTEAAKSFLARVLLYEATWEKYTPNIGYDLDGDGTTTGAGKEKPAGYPSVTDMLTEAKRWAGEVIDEAESGTFEIWNEADSLSYYYLFNLDDKGGNLCNPYGKGKASNKEFIFSVKYDFENKAPSLNLGHTVYTQQAGSFGMIFADQFLCHNGLPIFISTDGTMRQNNPDFLGYDSFFSDLRNRDYRFISSIRMPDRNCWSSLVEEASFPDGVNPYPPNVYPSCDPNLGDPRDPSDPAYIKYGIFRPWIGTSFTGGGYSLRKLNPEGTRVTNKESPDWPLIRLAEVHLIYAEAAVELGSGTISDGDLDKSVNKNRARGHIAPLNAALIAGKYDAGYWDHQQGKTIIKQMNMLDEIRRERGCELFGEGFRMNDLKRWGIAHINLTGQKLGTRILGTKYTEGGWLCNHNDDRYYGRPLYDPVDRPLRYGIYEGTGANDLDYGRSIANDPANLLWSQRDYLAPIPLEQIRLNPALTQNPGW